VKRSGLSVAFVVGPITFFALMICGSASGQRTFDLRGRLELVDRPPEATPVEAMLVSFHPLAGGYDLQVTPDHDGKFVLKNVRPGRYSLTLPFPGRIRTFSNGSSELDPDQFDLSSSDPGPLRIVASLKTSTLYVTARGVPDKSQKVIALLAPADHYLTLRLSCFSAPLKEPRTTFPFIPPGHYRLFIADSQFGSEITAYAPRFANFLKDHSTSLEVQEDGETKATATYVDGETIRRAVLEAGPIR
jgi:hypothetical protein